MSSRAPPPEGGTQVPIDEVTVGECIVAWPGSEDGDEGDGTVYAVQVIGCDRPHEIEVYDDVLLGTGDYPGEEILAGVADTTCLSSLNNTLAEQVGDTLDWSYLYPTRDSWDKGDRTIICLLYTLDEPFVGYQDERLAQ